MDEDHRQDVHVKNCQLLLTQLVKWNICIVPPTIEKAWSSDDKKRIKKICLLNMYAIDLLLH